MILALLACGGGDDSDEPVCCTWQGTDLSPDPQPAPSPVPTSVPTPTPTPCDLGTPGLLCTWMGVEAVPLYDPEGLARQESHLYYPLDLEFGPDGLPYVIDFYNNRIRVVDPDDTVRTLLGTGDFGDGFFDPTSGTWHDGPGLEYKIAPPSHVSFDPADRGWLYVTAWKNSRVVRYSFATLEVEYFAGTGVRAFGGDGGPALEAAFNLPSSAVFDGLGNLYVSDQANQVIRRIDANGVITTVAGVQGSPGYNGDGLPALEAQLHGDEGSLAAPAGRMVWSGGALVFVDTQNHLVRRLDPVVGTLDRVAGTYVTGPETRYGGISAAGGYAGDGGPALEARLNLPRDLAVAPDGTIYVADTSNHCVRVITPDGLIDTFAGVCGVEGFAFLGAPSLAENLPAREGLLSNPHGVAVDGLGNVYIADTYNQVIRVVWHDPSPPHYPAVEVTPRSR